MSKVYCEICKVTYDTDKETRGEHAERNHALSVAKMPVEIPLVQIAKLENLAVKLYAEGELLTEREIRLYESGRRDGRTEAKFGHNPIPELDS